MIYFNFYHLAKCMHNFINFHFYHCQIYILFIIFFYFYPFAKTGWFLVPSAATCGRQLPNQPSCCSSRTHSQSCKIYLSDHKIHLSKFQNIFVQIEEYICLNCPIYLSKPVNQPSVYTVRAIRIESEFAQLDLLYTHCCLLGGILMGVNLKGDVNM